MVSKWLRAGGLSLALFGVSGISLAQDMAFVFKGSLPRMSPAVDGREAPTAWRVGEYSGVRRVPKEAGSGANDYAGPWMERDVGELLQQVSFEASGKRAQPLFGRDEADALARVLVDAFAVANVDEDILIASTARREGGLLDMPKTVTARVFVSEGQLNLIVHSVREDAASYWRGTKLVPSLTFGSRQHASTTKLVAPQGSNRRGDWLQLAIGRKAVTRTQPPPVTPVRTAASPARDESFYAQQAQRLKGLQALHTQGLISDAEYQDKREEVLKGL